MPIAEPSFARAARLFIAAMLVASCATGPAPGTPPTPVPAADDEARPMATGKVEPPKGTDDDRIDVPPSRRLRLVPFGHGLPQQGQWRNGVAVGDLNGDGHPDIALPPARQSFGTPLIFLGDGRGTWQRWSHARFPRLPYDYGDVQAGDIDGDGHLDLALAMHLRGVVALLGNGRGEFTSASRGLDLLDEARGSLAFSSRALRLAHWTSDRRLDILALGEGPSFGRGGPARGASLAISRGVALYVNQTDGSWVRRDHGLRGDRVFGDSLVLADFVGDGRLGFATSSNVHGRKDVVNVRGSGEEWVTRPVDAIRSRAYITAVAAADFARRGRADLVTAYLTIERARWQSGIDVLTPRPDGAWTRRALAAQDGRMRITTLATGDIDGDGHHDLVALTETGALWIFLGDGAGSFRREPDVPTPFGPACAGSRAELVDLDRDGRDEIVAAFGTEVSRDCVSGGGVTAWKHAGG